MISSLLGRPLCLAAGVLIASTAWSATLTEFQEQARRNGVVLELTDYPTTVDGLAQRVKSTLEKAEADLKVIGDQDPAKATFESTFRAFDLAAAPVMDLSSLVGTIAETSTDQALREAANERRVEIDAWSVGLDYREDLYRVAKAVAEKGLKLEPAQQRLVDEAMRSYRRAGLALPPEARAEVEKLRKDLAALQTEFSLNVNQARGPLDFTAEELAGVPEDFLNSPGVKQEDGRYRVMANVTWHAATVMENASNAETRKKVSITRQQLARAENVPLMKRLVELRALIAEKLGYTTWADYQTEVKMVRTGAAAAAFEEKLVAGLQPKYEAEMEALRLQKVAETGQADARIEPWDISYYTSRLMKEKYAVDKQALRVYFPYQSTLEGMFGVYQKIFGLRFTRVEPPYVWAPEVQFFVVQDGATGAPLGSFYLDMFPREGKYNHFACFPQRLGHVRSDGTYSLPVAALICNFPAPSGDKPSLLQHDDVVTLFHEFGHVMHMILGRAAFVSQSSFMVPQDFVEAPSQMLESWPWDKAVLDTFAADYRDPNKKIPAEILSGLNAARQATEGYTTRRQLSLGLMDLSLHHVTLAQARALDVVAVTNGVSARVTLAPPPDTAFIAYFGHLTNGYDAGYYGYLWSKVIALDMASVFSAAPGGFLDEDVGRRLRSEIYAAAHTRDVSVSVERFLGRKQSDAAFLEHVGIAKP